MDLNTQVIDQAIESLRSEGSDGDVQAAVYMEMDEVSFEHGSWPWTEEDVTLMLSAVQSALA